MIDIAELARRAGVSATTVSQALSGKGRISQKTRIRVQSLAEELGYSPNPNASGLRSGRSKLIALQMSRADSGSVMPKSSYFADLLNGCASAAAEQGWLVVIVPSELPAHLLQKMGIRCGIIVDPTGGEPLLTGLTDGGVVVTMGRIIPAPGFDLPPDSRQMVIDHDVRAIVATALQHLVQQGYRRPVLLTVKASISYVEDTIEAFQQWTRDRDIIGLVARGNSLMTEETAARTMTDLLSSSPRPDAIYTTNEAGALGALRAARSLGISVPNELGIIAAMDSLMLSNTSPRVTTIDLKPFEMGRAAAHRAIAAASGVSTESQPEPLAFDLQERESTDKTAITMG